MRHITSHALENLRGYYLGHVYESIGRYDAYQEVISSHVSGVLTRLCLSETTWVVRGDKPVRQLLAKGESFTCCILQHNPKMTVLEVLCGYQKGLVYITRKSSSTSAVGLKS